MSIFNFQNLTPEVREIMLDEINADVEKGKLYLSPRLNNAGLEAYPTLLMEAVNNGTEFTFQNSLEHGSYFNSHELRQGKPVKVPSNAAQLLAQSEFNRYYIRALCVKSIKGNIDFVEIYRARESSWKRQESEAKIGMDLNASDLLEDLRSTIGAEPKILPEINSGLSVRLK